MEKIEINWTGNLVDDCSADWEGMTLRAEEMDKTDWWWVIYNSRSGDVRILKARWRFELFVVAVLMSK